jgi:hypothetical protein
MDTKEHEFPIQPRRRRAAFPLAPLTSHLSPRPLVIAVHGILTRMTAVNWPDALWAAWAQDSTLCVLKKEYIGAPLPAWNKWVKNSLVAKGLVAEVEAYVHANGLGRISFVAHSNGCDIVVKTVKRLARQGIPTDTIILTGSVTEPDVEASGLATLMRRGMLRRAVAYCSEKDRAIGLHIKWPYRNLGITGWKSAGIMLATPRVHTHDVRAFLNGEFVTRRFDNFDHGNYFDDLHRNITFELFRKDLAL